MAWMRSGVRAPSGPPVLLSYPSNIDDKSGWYHGIAFRPSRMKGFFIVLFVFSVFLLAQRREENVMITRTKYNPKEIEAKWQTQWQAAQLYHASDNSPEP